MTDQRARQIQRLVAGFVAEGQARANDTEDASRSPYDLDDEAADWLEGFEAAEFLVGAEA